VRRKSWLKFCDEVKDLKATAKLHKALTKDPFYPEMLKKEDGTYTKSNIEVVDLLIRTHFPGTKPVEQVVPQPVRVPNSTDWNLAKTVVTDSRLKWAIDSFKPYKSTGMDGINRIMLQVSSHSTFYILHSTGNSGHWIHTKILERRYGSVYSETWAYIV
jgi:hypothetical protein